MSYALGGRSGNRGECAQPCRRRYSLIDADGKVLARDRHLLSLRDLNLSAHLGELIDAGVTSFKIEGRLKDAAYVANVVSAYRRRLDAALEVRGLHKSSSGYSTIGFEPDLTKTFNRGYTTYFLNGRGESPGSIDTPKMMGEFVGQVVAMKGKSFTLDADVTLHSGDGICFFDAEGELQGTVINATHACARAHARAVTPQEIAGIRVGTCIYRNHDHAFLKQLKQGCERKIVVRLKLEETPGSFTLTATDEDGNVAAEELTCEKVKAEKPKKALDTVEKQLCKTGDTEFACKGVEIEWEQIYFLPVSTLNALRRDALEKLSAVRAQNRPVLRRTIRRNAAPYPEKALSYLGNALNQKAVAFYRRHGVEEVAPAAESGLDMHGKRVMRTRYCIKHQMGLCPQEADAPSLKEPLYLVDEKGHRYRLRFDCAACEMGVYF
jgi:putative protease